MLCLRTGFVIQLSLRKSKKSVIKKRRLIRAFFNAQIYRNARGMRRKDIYMSEFKIISTQEEFDAAIKSRLIREKEKYADYDELKNRVNVLEKENGVLRETTENNKSSMADYDKQIESLQGKLKDFERKDLRLRAAVENGLPVEFADRLVGDDEESVKADAERFSEFFKSKEPTPPMKSNEPKLGDAGDGGWRALSRSLKNERSLKRNMGHQHIIGIAIMKRKI